MLFSSYSFIVGFLPMCLAIYAILGALGAKRATLWWLAIASTVYYAWTDWAYLLPIVAISIVINYSVGLVLGRSFPAGAPTGAMPAAPAWRFWLLALGIAANLGALGWYKYAKLFVRTVDALTDVGWPTPSIVLPIGISFFTFTQIAFLVDAARGKVTERDPLAYWLFVTFFPHLIAGPILHHSEMMPQFTKKKRFRITSADAAIGLTIFIIGLFKKVVLADTLATYSTPVFDMAQAGVEPSFFEGWMAALAYTFQLYFDFSGYSDMAIGLARLFGILLPLNFNSPYKSVNIVEFWRRWHMTLSRFLRDYLYFPLGGNRKGTSRRYVNLMITMLLGGLWHGADWTFVAWGALHGAYLVVNHAWQTLTRGTPVERVMTTALGYVVSLGVTFLAVVVGWVFFRATSFGAAWRILGAMAGGNGFGFEAERQIDRKFAILWIVAMLGVVWILPNTQEVMGRFRPALDCERPRILPALLWRPSWRWVAFLAVLSLLSLMHLSRVSEFIYYQF